MTSWLRLSIGILTCALFAGSLLALEPQAQPRTVSDGVYTAQQATRGQMVYNDKCSTCHANNLAGRLGPPLTGTDFLAVWSGQSVFDLANKIQKTMPKQNAPTLTAQESADLLAYMLQVGKYPAGNTELTMNEAALKPISFPGRAAPGQAPPSSVTALPSAGSVAQVMRGILFPSANIVFTTQSIDPGVKRAPVDTGAGGFDWLTWGQSVYAGWEVVDYAAVSVAESAQLMLTPGRRCENNIAVPVNDPDWIKFTMELAEAGRASYKASQTRVQETVADSTNQLNDSCMNCHRVFRGRVHCAKP